MVRGNNVATQLLLTHGPDATIISSTHYTGNGTTKFSLSVNYQELSCYRFHDTYNTHIHPHHYIIKPAVKLEKKPSKETAQ